MADTPARGLGRVALLGTGLIGGSFAAALKRHGLCLDVVGYSTGDAARARDLGLVDEIAASPEAAVAGCDTVVLAAPVSANCDLLERIASSLRAGMLVTDLSSVKMPVVRVARERLGQHVARFVPSHPIAGSERSGPEAADASLFEDRAVVLSPLPENDADAVALLAAIWERIGARVMQLPADEHDRLYAQVSHWPHAIAFGLAAAVGRDDVPAALVGPGLADLTRTAASSPELWADILLSNVGPALAAAARFRQEMKAIESAMRRGDRDALVALLEAGARWRRGFQ
ncbi:MAG: prephenate dehydrogenase [Burkholderiaceae bacterium]|nr:prephenate dehydrogenase [Burkholderiaceae bacterium]